jgi:hypothetical protein
MPNKKQVKKAHRKATRAGRSAEKALRQKSKVDGGNMGKLVDRIQERAQRDTVNLAAARIINEPAE